MEPLGHPVFSVFWLTQLVNITLVVLIVWLLLKKLWRTAAMSVILMFIVVYMIAAVLENTDFYIINYVMEALAPVLLISVVVLFHDEIRDMLGSSGRFFSNKFRRFFGGEEVHTTAVGKIIDACLMLRRNHLGGLFVIEREECLDNYYEAMVPLENLPLDKHLITALFQHPGILHDGAIVIRDNKIIGAKALLPTSRKTYFGGPAVIREFRSKLGTRHRAGLGITEVSDCLTVIVSEETGNFSLAHDGTLEMALTVDILEELLFRYLEVERPDEVENDITENESKLEENK